MENSMFDQSLLILSPSKFYASAYSASIIEQRHKERDFQNQYQAGVEVEQFFNNPARKRTKTPTLLVTVYELLNN
jgi:hypothetical protein